jgi:TetR/AcrR family transcriptional repressor of nem operon
MKKNMTAKGQLTRQKLFEAGLKFFVEKGYESSSVDEIVGSIGLTSGVFYSNFKSKEDLLKQVIERRIVKTKELLLVKHPNEQDREWVSRALSTYLSPQHRDGISSSCPMSTISQELTKLRMVTRTGLDIYVQDFQAALKESLGSIKPGLEKKAPALISICIGGLITARTIKDKKLSDEFLVSCRNSALEFVFTSKEYGAQECLFL